MKKTDPNNLAAARKRRQAILDMLHARGSMTRVEIRDSLGFVSDDTLGNTLSKMSVKGEIEYLPGKKSHRLIRALVRETFSHDLSANIAKARACNPACQKGYKPQPGVPAPDGTTPNAIAGLRVVRMLDRPAYRNQGGQGVQKSGIQSSLMNGGALHV